MDARALLTDHYQIDVEEKLVVSGREGYISNSMLYFIMNALNNETIYLEQAVLAYYLRENNWKHMAIPIKNSDERWFTEGKQGRYIVFEVSERIFEKESTGITLASLHEIGAAYQFEPMAISSYGQWKKLWIEKMTILEENIEQFARGDAVLEKAVYLDALPYLIGLSENAIQYLRETEESEGRFSEVDRGTFCFWRFHGQTDEVVLWSDELVYDHPARDIAEYIRYAILSGASDEAIRAFLHDYQQVRPLSLFSWRLIYARLLFPVHLLDSLEASIERGEGASFENLFYKQGEYEQSLRSFFGKIGVAQLPELDWLNSY